MSNKLKFIWIDDDPKRKEESDNIQETLGVNLDFKDVRKQNLSEALEKIISNSEPDLILMDHKLQNTESKLFTTGSTAAEIIREKWPVCPIVCITGVELSEVDSYKKSIYEDVISISQISKYYSTLTSMAKSFRTIKSKRIENIDQLLALLKAPKEDLERLKTILPENLKKDTDSSLPLYISRWVRKTLMAKPGFLYDRLWAATLLGIKEKSFAKVEELFAKEKYKGVFSDENNERWWQSGLRKILSGCVDDPELIYPWEQGRKLDGITTADYSKCYVSKEPFPETVAYTDETAAKRAPVRLRYTERHPQFEESLFFEEIRMVKGEE